MLRLDEYGTKFRCVHIQKENRNLHHQHRIPKEYRSRKCLRWLRELHGCNTILLELTGTFALKNNSDNELEVIIETAEGKYQKDYVFLNNYTMYVVEDISGAEVDKYHYEINFLPEFGLKVTQGRVKYTTVTAITNGQIDEICIYS